MSGPAIGRCSCFGDADDDSDWDINDVVSSFVGHVGKLHGLLRNKIFP